MAKKRVKRKENILIRELRESWSYIKESKNYIWAVAAVFIISTFVGFIYPEFYAENILNFLRELIGRTQGMDVPQLTAYIFWNNLQASFFGILLGAILGIFPVLAAIANGYVLGFVSNMSVAAVGYASLWRLFPHGIFEIPAVIISFGLGIKLGFFFLAKRKGEEFVKRLVGSLRVFFIIVIPLLVIAALIEVFLIKFVP